MTAEEQVRAAWDGVRYENGRVYAKHPVEGAEWILSGNSNQRENLNRLSPEAAWHAAFAFTEEHKEKVRRLEMDIAYMQEVFADPFEDGWGDDERQRSDYYESSTYEDGVADWIHGALFGKPPDDGDVRQFVKESFRAASIIERLQAIRADLMRGTRQQ